MSGERTIIRPGAGEWPLGPPRTLTGRARAHWFRLLAGLRADPRHLARISPPDLAAYCRLMARFERADAAGRDELFDRLLTIGQRLGLSPGSRARLLART